MFFTENDYKKIYEWLQVHAIKDSELKYAFEPFRGDETVTLVQQGANVRVPLTSFVEQLKQLQSPDIINVTSVYDRRNLDLNEAIRLVPALCRKIGQVLIFIDKDEHWRMYQFQSDNLGQWNTLDAWVNLIGEIQALGFIPDEETVTLDNKVLKIKDKAYDPQNFSGMGKVFLRSNVTALSGPNGTVKTNILRDYMIEQPNTIYTIEYDFDLANQYVQIPSNCILKINGGSLSNGTLICDNTTIDSDKPLDCTIEGTYHYTKPFGYRPQAESVYVGYCHFDTDLNKPIWSNGTNWVDANGNNV